jgi:hypothetical protein
VHIQKQDVDWRCFRPRHDGIFRGLGYNTTHSWTRYHVDVSVQIHVPNALPLLDLHQYSMKRRLGGPHKTRWQFGQEKKSLQFLPYGRSIGSWICLTQKTYTCHTVQNTYSASMAVSDSQSIFRFNLRCLLYSVLFRFLSRMRCTSMGVWGSMIY